MSGVVKRIAIHSLPNDTVRNIRASLNRQAEKSGITGKVFKRLAKAAEFAPL
jgi:hypothetical protein